MVDLESKFFYRQKNVNYIIIVVLASTIVDMKGQAPATHPHRKVGHQHSMLGPCKHHGFLGSWEISKGSQRKILAPNVYQKYAHISNIFK